MRNQAMQEYLAKQKDSPMGRALLKAFKENKKAQREIAMNFGYASYKKAVAAGLEIAMEDRYFKTRPEIIEEGKTAVEAAARPQIELVGQVYEAIKDNAHELQGRGNEFAVQRVVAAAYDTFYPGEERSDALGEEIRAAEARIAEIQERYSRANGENLTETQESAL